MSLTDFWTTTGKPNGKVEAKRIQEVTWRYLCGQCSVLISEKEPRCKRCGAVNSF